MKKSSSHVNILLLELLIVIFFFMLCAPTVVELFGASRLKSMHAGAINAAMLEAENIAEELYGRTDAEKRLEEKGFRPMEGTDGYTVERAEYTLNARITETAEAAGVLRTVTLTAFRGDRQLFELPASCYFPGEVSP